MSSAIATLRAAVLPLAVLCGCGSTPLASPLSSRVASSASLAAPAVSASTPPPAASAERDLKLEVVQVLNVPVRWIALGEGTRLAALSDPPQVGDERGLHPLPLPAALRAKAGEVDDARIYFGRDNEPRIMGTRRSAGAESPIYWRHTAAAGWRDGREEIGQLGARSGQPPIVGNV